jgi:hypothetical protein
MTPGVILVHAVSQVAANISAAQMLPNLWFGPHAKHAANIWWRKYVFPAPRGRELQLQQGCSAVSCPLVAANTAAT